MYAWSMIFLKLSLGVFFLRILISHRQRYIVYIAMVLSLVVNLLDTFWNIFSCGNPTLYFAHRLSGKCASNALGMAESYVQTVANTGTDLTLACMPFFLLRGSIMPTSTKLSVGFILILATMCVYTEIEITPVLTTSIVAVSVALSHSRTSPTTMTTLIFSVITPHSLLSCA